MIRIPDILQQNQGRLRRNWHDRGNTLNARAMAKLRQAKMDGVLMECDTVEGMLVTSDYLEELGGYDPLPEYLRLNAAELIRDNIQS